MSKHLVSAFSYWKLLKILAIATIIVVWIQQTCFPLTSPMSVDEADAYSRLWHIIYLPASNVWLPGFQYIMRLFSFIPDNGFYLNYRLGIYLFTILLSIIIFLIIQKSTKKILPALVGLSLFLFHPLTRQLSVVTLTEIPWLFFLFLSIYFLFFAKYKNKIPLGLLSFVISETLRYESWFLLLLLIPYLFIHSKKEIHKFIKPFLVITIFPVLWMLFLNRFFGDPVSFIFEKIKCSHSVDIIDPHWSVRTLTYFINQQLDIYIFPHFFLVFFTLASLFCKNKGIRSIISISVFLFICFFIETFTTFNENTNPRFFYYLVPLLSIVIPISFYTIFSQYPIFFKSIIIAIYCLAIYKSFSRLDNNYYTNVDQITITDVNNVLVFINHKNIEQKYLCLNQEDYFFSNILEYRLQYKNFNLDCRNNLLQQNGNSIMVVSSQDEKLYDSTIDYTGKEKLINHIIYSF